MRIAVTGIGVVSSLGLGYEEFAESVGLGVTGLAPWSQDETILAGEVAAYELNDHLVAEKTYLDRCSELALIATKLCLDHAGLDRPPAAEERSGLVLGTRFGCHATMAAYSERIRKRGARFATPVLFTHAFLNTPASLLAIDYRLRGYHTTVTSGDSSGSLALQTACLALAAEHADAVLAGGVEALSPELMAAYRERLCAHDDPDEYDPFAAEGILLGEGAAMFLLQPWDDAGDPLAELVWREPAGDAALRSANGDGRGGGDGAAPKGLWGECFGASGALAAAAAVAALQQSVLPPVIAGDGSLEERREPVEFDGDSVLVEDGPVRLSLRLP